MLDAVVDYLPSPLDVPPVMGKVGDKMEERWPRDDAPFSALAFKIMTDPYVGTLTFLRVYSGRLESGSSVLNSTKAEARADRAAGQDAREQARGDLRSLRRRYLRGRAARHDYRRHAVRPGASDRARSRSSFPIRSSRSRSSPRPRPTRTSSASRCTSWREEDPSFRVSVNARNRPDADCRDGRVASGDHRRPPAARVQSRRERRQAAGRVSRDHPQARARPRAVSSARPAVTASSAWSTCGSSRWSKGGGFEFVDEHQGRLDSAQFIPSVEEGVKEAMETGVLAGYPMVDMQGALARRQVPRGRFVGTGVQDCGLDGFQGGGAERPTRCCSSR